MSVDNLDIRKEGDVDARTPEMKLNDALKKIEGLERRIEVVEGECVTKLWLNDFLNRLFSSAMRNE